MNLSCYQLQVNCFKYQRYYIASWLPQSKKAIIDNKVKEKGIKTYHREKSTNWNERDKEKTKGTKGYKNWKAMNKMVTINPYLSVITFGVNGLNSPMKRQRVAEWIF